MNQNILTPTDSNIIKTNSAPSSTETKLQPLHQKERFAQNKLLAHRLAQSQIGSNSPTDAMMSPITAKLSMQKKKNYTKAKPTLLNSKFNQAANEN